MPDPNLVTPDSRDYQGKSRLLLVAVTCPLCPQQFSGVTHRSARAAFDGHIEALHPEVQDVLVDATEYYRKGPKS